MQIYFGAVPQDEVFDTDAMFASDQDDDHLFYYGVEYGSNPGGTDEVLVYDGLDRYVPVDIESVPALIEALKLAYTLHITTSNMRKVVDIVTDFEATATISPTA